MANLNPKPLHWEIDRQAYGILFANRAQSPAPQILGLPAKFSGWVPAPRSLLMQELKQTRYATDEILRRLGNAGYILRFGITRGAFAVLLVQPTSQPLSSNAKPPTPKPPPPKPDPLPPKPPAPPVSTPVEDPPALIESPPQVRDRAAVLADLAACEENLGKMLLEHCGRMRALLAELKQVH